MRSPWRAAARSSPSTTRPRTDRLEFLRARFDAGLAWVHFPEGLGGLGLPREPAGRRREALASGGRPRQRPAAGSASGWAWPRRRSSRSAPRSRSSASSGRCGPARRSGASSSASPAPAPTSPRSPPARSATATTGWSTARRCGPRRPPSPTGRSWSPAPTRTCPSTRGLTYFLCDMHDPGRRGPAAAADHRRGRVQRGVPHRRADPRRAPARRGRRGLAGRQRHPHERAGRHRRRRRARGESGMVGKVATTWRERPELRTPELHERLLRSGSRPRSLRLTGHPAAPEARRRRSPAPRARR